ncbi:unnamed protein product [Phaedon cochleariae]|uniref:Uncharacterized protein n=1 Tax=Phaedon cochleariae TaxID=80249 RepID=A0A9P0DEJ4_PHACE|nr:unnamed protein product [Phaedon cochleariae]
MFTPTSVSLSGPAFSFLLYENSKCRFQQEGFLIGEIVEKETKTITDNDQQQVNITKTIKINSAIPCPYSHFFYSGSGKLHKEKLSDFLGTHVDRVVAWYKYQRVGNLKFTLRDNIIHSQLMDFFQIPPELFTCCLLNNEISENGSTYTYSQTFLRVNNQRIDRLPITIPNLSEPNDTYKNSEPASETFRKILGDLKIDRRSTQGSVVINRIQNALQKHIDSVVQKLSESEQYIYELEEDLHTLQISQKLKKMNEELISENASPTRTSESEDSPRVYHGIDSTPSEKESSPELQRKTGRAGSVRGRGGKRGLFNDKETKATRRPSRTEKLIKTSED